MIDYPALNFLCALFVIGCILSLGSIFVIKNDRPMNILMVIIFGASATGLYFVSSVIESLK